MQSLLQDDIRASCLAINLPQPVMSSRILALQLICLLAIRYGARFPLFPIALFSTTSAPRPPFFWPSVTTPAAHVVAIRTRNSWFTVSIIVGAPAIWPSIASRLQDAAPWIIPTPACGWNMKAVLSYQVVSPLRSMFHARAHFTFGL